MALKSNWKAPGFALFVIAAFPLIDCIPTDGGGSGGGSIDGGSIDGGGIGGGGIDGGDVGGGDIDGGAVGGGGAGGGGSGGDDFTMRGLEVGSAKNALFRFSADGTKGKKIDPGPIGSYEFSANRMRIAVDRGNDYAMGQPQRTFVFLDPDGSNSATLVFPDTSIIPNSPPSPGGGGTSLRSMISPTGSYLAYAVQENSQQLTVYVARTDGSAPQMVLPADYNHLMGWSPVEDKLVVSTPGPLYLYDANANSLAEVTSPGVNFAGSISIWSPDGERLVFSEGGPNNYILASVNSQGLDRWDLSTDLEQGMGFGFWSHDAQTLAIPQYDSLLQQRYIRFVKADGTMQFDFVGTQSLGFCGWTATDQFVYQQDDGAIKSITFGGQPVDLAPPDTLLSCSVLANGRVWFRRSTSYMKTINPDGSNLVTYPVPDLVGSTYSYDGNVVVVAEKPDANGIVHVYAAPTDNAQTSLILTTTQKKYYVGLMPIMDSGAIAVITEDSSFRWILPTNNGFQLIYPQISLTSLDQAYAIPAGPF